jgi:uncharacterized membrane protein
MRDARIIGGCALAWAVHLFLAFNAHHQLRTPGFDLSVFDYAIWTTGTGAGAAFVPMFGYSLLAQHFMPSLLLLAPFGAVFTTPVYLLALQSAFFVAGAYLMYRLAARHVPGPYAVALLAAYLLSRRTHSAATSYFYIESAEPLLIFGALLAWTSGRRAWYWVLVALALGCKEDVAVYFALFGAIEAYSSPPGTRRREALLTIAVSVAWGLAAVFIAIPYWADLYGLKSSNLFFSGRFGLAESGGTEAALERVFSIATLERLLTVASATGLLCLLAPRWFAIVIIGVALNVAAIAGTNQSGLVGHYLWPILPWLFMAAIHGAKRLGDRQQRWLPWIALVIAIADTPLPGAAARAMQSDPAARVVRTQLGSIDLSGAVLAQSNLIPHVPRRLPIFGYGVLAKDQAHADLVLLTKTGDLWPLGADGVDREVAKWRTRPEYDEVSSGPLWAFRKK